ncbi:hypothetical protein [Mesorhizobium sp. B2-3-2]|uniref:nSTAND1 domain-containing NTPase n=2 Tax=Mesorhizobium TaxID=68287 RepID=UPI0032B2D944
MGEQQLPLEAVDEGEQLEAEDDEESGLVGLIAAWQELHDDPQAELPRYKLTPSPYPGLRSFASSEGLLYFGRSGEDEALAKRLEIFNVVGVLGGSGSGKSSLVLAGLLPYLRRFQRIPNRGGRWYLVTARPGKTPSKAIVDAVWTAVGEPLAKRPFGERALAATFAQFGVSEALSGTELLSACQEALVQFLLPAGKLDHDRLLRFANEELQTLDSISSGGMQVGAANLLIVIDQFEEIFREEVDRDGANAIVELVKAVHGRARQGLFIALTMRSEEVHRCAEYEGLSEIIFATSTQVELLTKERDIHAAIVQPARRVFDAWGVSYGYDEDERSTSPFSRDLVDLLTAETQRLSRTLDHKPDSLPLLQHALRAIWEEAIKRWGKEHRSGNSGWSPKLTLDDFRDRKASEPLQVCLNRCAENARQEALQEGARHVSEGTIASRRPAVSQMIDSAFTCMARMDDRGRWVRRFATPEEIATTAVLDVHAVRAKRPFHRIFAVVRHEPPYIGYEADRRSLVDAVMQVFCRRGYVLSRDDIQARRAGDTPHTATRTYDVSHESLIRSWEHCLSILEQAKSTRKALLETLEVANSLQAIKGKRNLARRLSLWVRGGEKRLAAEALRHVTLANLSPLFLPPRWLGETWAENQLIEEWQRTGNWGVPPAEKERLKTDKEAQRKLARARIRSIADLFHKSKLWNEGDGFWPSGHSRWLAKVALLPLAAVLTITVLGINGRNSNKIITLLGGVAGITDESARNDLVAAQSQLVLALSRANASSEENWTYLTYRLTQTTYVLDTATEILNQKARSILKNSVGRVGWSQLLPGNIQKTDVRCGQVSKTSGLPLVSTSEFSLKYVAPSGFAFVSSDARGLLSQTVSLDEGDKVCVDVRTSILLRVQPNGLIIYPLTIIDKSTGSDGIKSKVVRINEPGLVTLYAADSVNVDNAFNSRLVSYLSNNILSRKVQGFTTESTNGFAVPLEGDGQFLYISQISGVSQPQLLPDNACARIFGSCSADKADAYQNREFNGLKLEGGSYTLKLRIGANDPAAVGEPKCRSDQENCPQFLTLFRRMEGVAEKGIRFKQVHIGLPIVDARIDARGYLDLRDTSGRGWRYIVGWEAFTSALDDARSTIFPSSEDGAGEN